MASILLNNIPKEIKEHVLKTQLEIKLKKGTQFSQERTIIQMLREHKELTQSPQTKKIKE